ncbi:Leucine-rich repeat-containing protein 56 like protein [Aduncisulcus paluster]|uniref:Leucine-rich repeat-containing protein 56 like protein n=1 Tax=Aduncisulcus paluster TaxID=2918883 RepID=A0ABQ5KPL8_9EUKA|nr:Leucine-rich repeat-containing protein 56 like protein [Aduncisulcus paluster]
MDSPSREITEEFLKRKTKEDDLSLVTEFNIKVDSLSQTLSPLTVFLPNLVSLNLRKSNIHSFEAMASFSSLKVLDISECKLELLDGVSALSSLSILLMSGNKVSSLQPLGMCKSIELLDISFNLIHSKTQLLFLKPLSLLKHLDICGNPFLESESPSSEKSSQDHISHRLRDIVHSHLSNTIITTPLNSKSAISQGLDFGDATLPIPRSFHLSSKLGDKYSTSHLSLDSISPTQSPRRFTSDLTQGGMMLVGSPARALRKLRRFKESSE